MAGKVSGSCAPLCTRVLSIALLGCGTTLEIERSVTVDEATRVAHPRVVAVLHDGRPENVSEAIGVFRDGDDAYVLTTKGRVKIGRGDLLLVRGRFAMGEEIPGGGVVGRSTNSSLQTAGGVLLGLGGAAVICGVASAAVTASAKGWDQLGPGAAMITCFANAFAFAVPGAILMGMASQRPAVVYPEADSVAARRRQ